MIDGYEHAVWPS